ncbi:MAG: leucine-rich repeat domain-containing protein, partial [Clostridia bacterium]|nr:leucine-rich repeat domain-containing protein [Clostridia bacterium]
MRNILLSVFCLYLTPLTANAVTLQVDSITYILDKENMTASVAAQYEYSGADGTLLAIYSWLKGDIVIPSVITDESGNEYTVTSLEQGAFENLRSVTSVTLPNSVTSYGKYSFSSCLIPKVVLSENAPVIPAHCFHSALYLGSIDLPDCVTVLGDTAFTNCTRLTNVKFPKYLESMGKRCFSGCTSLTSAELPEGLETIGENAFYKCTALEKVSLPSTLTSLGESAFNGCTSLRSVEIPESITALSNQLIFYGCTSLETVVLPSTLTSITYSVFGGCTALKSVTCKALTPPELAENFSSIFPMSGIEDCVLYVPLGCVEAYEQSEWADYFSIIEEMAYFTVDPADGDEVEDITEITATSYYGIALSS